MFSAFPVVSLLCPSSCMVPEPELGWEPAFLGAGGWAGQGGGIHRSGPPSFCEPLQASGQVWCSAARPVSTLSPAVRRSPEQHLCRMAQSTCGTQNTDAEAQCPWVGRQDLWTEPNQPDNLRKSVFSRKWLPTPQRGSDSTEYTLNDSWSDWIWKHQDPAMLTP